MRKSTARHTAKIFKNGSSQAVRLPKEYRLPGERAAIYHLGRGIILQPICETWGDVYNAMEGLSEEDFSIMTKNLSEDLPPQERDAL